MPKSTGKLLLLDSNALIHRSFHALPPLTTPKGEQVNAVYGFANALLKAIQDEKPDYVVACFDVGKETFRSQLYPEYKAHRKETDHALTLQIPRVRQIVEVLNIPLFAQQGVEADDLVGSLASIAASRGLQSVIVTGDNDALQLVDDSTTVYSLRRGVTDTLTYDREQVFQKLGVYPNQVVDYKALAGDSSDNIPGAPGVGPKTAVELLQRYQTLERIYEHLDELKPRLMEILRTNRDQVFLSQRLATIRKDLQIELDLKAADVSNFDFSRVVSLFQELDFRSLLTKLPHDRRTTQPTLFTTERSASKEKVAPSLPYELINTIERWQQVSEGLCKSDKIVIDTETVTLGGPLIGIAFCWGDNRAAYLPVKPASPVGLELDQVRESLLKILSTAEIKKIGHNIKYDLSALETANLPVRGVWFDTMIASQLVNTQLYSHGLDALAFSELGIKKIPTTQLLGGKKDGVMTEAPLEELAAYACEDVIVTWRLFQKLWPHVEQQELKRVFYEIEMPLLPVLSSMERLGIMIDRPYLATLASELRQQLQAIERATYQLAGKEFNIASPSQLQEVLFTDLRLPVVGIKKIKSGYSTDADSLAKLRSAHPMIEKVLEYREVAKLLNTYIETLPALADGRGRVHTSFIQIGAATGRLASTEPNLQNIPIRTELGNKVRQAFIAAPGKKLLGADYSQAELRVLAHLSEDPGLIEAFHQKTDFHSAVAAQLGVDRRAAKAINFGIVYGLGATALANDLGVSTEEARSFIDRYFVTFPGVRNFIESKKEQARRDGFVATLFGRRRYLPDIHSPNMMLRSAAERMAVNMPCQGTVADLMKMAMVDVAQKLPPSASLLLQIHDELLLEVDDDSVDAVSALVVESMSTIATLLVPMITEVAVGGSWADLKG